MSAKTVDGLVRQQPRFLRFGSFEVDLRTGELRRNGAYIRLQNKPFQVLQFLLENCGEIVTRDELHRRLWPADTYVDFDTGLNTAVNRLRQALGDSADNPRFIQTLNRRGYRFIAPVLGAEVPGGSDPSGPAARTLGGGALKTVVRKLLFLAQILAVLAALGLVVWTVSRMPGVRHSLSHEPRVRHPALRSPFPNPATLARRLVVPSPAHPSPPAPYSASASEPRIPK